MGTREGEGEIEGDGGWTWGFCLAREGENERRERWIEPRLSWRRSEGKWERSNEGRGGEG